MDKERKGKNRDRKSGRERATSSDKAEKIKRRDLNEMKKLTTL